MGITGRLILGKTWSPGTDKSDGMEDEQEVVRDQVRLMGPSRQNGYLARDDDLVGCMIK